MTVQRPVTDTEDRLSVLLAAVAYLASYHARPFSKEAVLARLPSGVADDEITALKRMLDAVGLKTEAVARSLSQIDPGSLPVIAFEGGEPRVILSTDRALQQVEVLDPLSNAVETRNFDALSARLGSTVVLVAPKEAVTAARLSPEAKRIDPEEKPLALVRTQAP